MLIIRLSRKRIFVRVRDSRDCRTRDKKNKSNQFELKCWDELSDKRPLHMEKSHDTQQQMLLIVKYKNCAVEKNVD